MTFTPPSIEELVEKTNNLYKQFSQQLMLYSIDKPGDTGQSSSSRKQTTLQWWFARVQEVIDCKTKRETAHDVFNKLVNELKNVNADDLVQSRKATSFLIGALLHRYFRIIQEYNDYNNVVRFWYWYVGSCRLFMAIRSALKFPEVTTKEAASFTTEEFKSKDLGVRENLTGMDDASIVIHLETFRDNMLLKDELGEPRYKKYEHLKNDVNFEKHLKDIIDFYKPRAAAVLKQLKAILFIESLTVDVVTRTGEQMSILRDWHTLLSKQHPDFSTLNVETIAAHVRTNVKDEAAKEKILDLLYTPRIEGCLKHSQFNYETFLSVMNKAFTDSAVYTIVGGYSLLLRSEGIDKLKFNLYEVLGIEKTPEVLTKKSMSIYIDFLDQYIKANPTLKLNYDFFEGKETMSVVLNRTIKTFIEEMQSSESSQESLSEVRQVLLV